jgi:hypothetical protein
MIKPKLIKKSTDYKQGRFSPLNKEKYKGTFPIIYRSKMELNAMRMLDNNPNVLTWGSESVVIPYISPLDNKLHRYFVDMVASIKQKDGSIRKVLIEVKPFKQTQPPIFSNNKSQKTIIYENVQYAMNTAKFDAARKWCEKNNFLFLILTEKEITSNRCK